jgi:hypothetical protein
VAEEGSSLVLEAHACTAEGIDEERIPWEDADVVVVLHASILWWVNWILDGVPHSSSSHYHGAAADSRLEEEQPAMVVVDMRMEEYQKDLLPSNLDNALYLASLGLIRQN